MEDDAIVTLYWQRNEEALRASAEKYGSRLRGLAQRILADAHDAEECENDTYLAAWNAIPPHEPRSYLFAFLARITRHLSLDRCRSRDREKRGGGRVDALTEELIQCLPGGERPEEAWISRPWGSGSPSSSRHSRRRSGTSSSAATGTATPSRTLPGATDSARAR